MENTTPKDHLIAQRLQNRFYPELKDYTYEQIKSDKRLKTAWEQEELHLALQQLKSAMTYEIEEAAKAFKAFAKAAGKIRPTFRP